MPKSKRLQPDKTAPDRWNSGLNSGLNSSSNAAQTSARLLAVIQAIPRGFVLSYGAVAERAGLPGRARAVARALKLADEPNLPWQRVIRSDGSCAVPGQQALLVAEGVRFTGNRIERQFWQRPPADVQTQAQLDQFLWGMG